MSPPTSTSWQVGPRKNGVGLVGVSEGRGCKKGFHRFFNGSRCWDGGRRRVVVNAQGSGTLELTQL